MSFKPPLEDIGNWDADRVVDDGQGNARALGNFESATRLEASSWTKAGNPIVSESDYVEYDIWPKEVMIKNQGSYGACNAHTTALGLELLRWLLGMPHIPMSAWWVYGLLTGGWDVGSNPMDSLKLLMATGCAPESDVPWGMFNPKKFSAAAKADAPRFKAEVGAALTTPDEFMSALMLRRPINGTIHVGGGFNNLDSEGVPGLTHGTDNHAVAFAFGAKKSQKWGWLAKMANSWDVTWGWNGFCWIPIDYLYKNRSAEYYELSAATDDPQDTTLPPRIA